MKDHHADEKSIHALYIHSGLRNFALAMVGLFVPIFLYQQGVQYFGGDLVGGIKAIIIFLALLRLASFSFQFVATKFLLNQGVAKSIMVGCALLSLSILMLNIASSSFLFIIPAALLFGAYTPFYWHARHGLVSEGFVVGRLGSEVGSIIMIDKVGGVLGPVVGGFIIALIGFQVLFYFGLVLILLSVIPLFYVKHQLNNNYDISVKEVIFWLLNKKHSYTMLAFSGQNVSEVVATFFYPVFIFLIAGSYEKTGELVSVTLALGMITAYLSGKYYDKKHNAQGLKISATAKSVIWAFRPFVVNFPQLAILDGAMKLIAPFHAVSYYSAFYEDTQTKGGHTLLLLVAREWIFSLMFIVLLTAIYLSLGLTNIWLVIFGFASAGSLLSMFIWNKK